MWPFRKKPPKNPTSGSFQEYLQTYAPPPPQPVETPIEAETVCPLCMTIYPPRTFSTDYPICGDCASEAVDIDVEPLEAFLAKHTPEQFDDMLARWEAAEGFNPDYKKLKSDRIRHLKALKVKGR